ncbi:hypothetical protein [Hymenobacter jeollabukensis]|uniref:Uncharacterized protein n=1 Tax=Hymenobacter jeollabukensis TaxID=2025313 RepID=A0A5R8WKV8_9BACT|nr:hypothetical protein [Hymenobacter jeollabukensis]TLM89474.1 hypothetical protein FDY95_20595 [Hymenobacter jeollabukensis]
MTNVTLIAEVVFYATKAAWPKFPMSGPRRMSLWGRGAPGSSPAEFQLTEPLYAATPTVVPIATIIPEALESYLQVGSPILFGTYPHAVGEGRIIRIEPYEHKTVWVAPKKPNGPI